MLNDRKGGGERGCDGFGAQVNLIWSEDFSNFRFICFFEHKIITEWLYVFSLRIERCSFLESRVFRQHLR